MECRHADNVRENYKLVSCTSAVSTTSAITATTATTAITTSS